VRARADGVVSAGTGADGAPVIATTGRDSDAADATANPYSLTPTVESTENVQTGQNWTPTPSWGSGAKVRVVFEGSFVPYPKW
jgi:hypothetical protein